MEDDQWVEHLGNVAMSDEDYLSMIHYLEAGSHKDEISKDCELSVMHNHLSKLSVHTLKGGQVLILRDNHEILIPKKERANILNLAHAENHRGVEAMIRQLRGKIFWEGMNGEAKDFVRKCEPCQRNARGHRQDVTEISHTNMFNLAPNDTLHVDFCQYDGVNYIVLVDRLTGYIGAERTTNQTTDAAIQVIRNWSAIFGFPLKIISDRGGGFRDDFVHKLNELKVKHVPSSSYHPQSNSLAERAVGSLKHSLKKATKNITQLGLKEILFQINANISS